MKRSFKEKFRKALVIGKTWPEPTSSAAGTRMMQLLLFLEQQGTEILFASHASTQEASAPLETFGYRTSRIQLNHPSFDEFILTESPDLVIFDRFSTEEQYGWRVQQHAPNAVRILDTEDLHCLRQAREKAHSEKRELRDEDLFSDIAFREIASIYRCDLSLIISPYEIELLKDVFRVPENLLYHLPFCEPDPIEGLPYSQRKDFIFIGNFLHAPNADAARYLAERIWPSISQQLPEARLNIYGPYANSEQQRIHQPASRIFVHGRAESADEEMKRHRVCIAPLRFGAGLKGKLVDAMRNGTPSVTTSIGAEGFYPVQPWPGAITNDENEFVQQAVKLYSDEAAWTNVHFRIPSLFDQNFNRERLFNGLRHRLEITHFLSARLDNFTGQMLSHQQFHAARHLARFIELKEQMKAMQ